MRGRVSFLLFCCTVLAESCIDGEEGAFFLVCLVLRTSTLYLLIAHRFWPILVLYHSSIHRPRSARPGSLVVSSRMTGG